MTKYTAHIVVTEKLIDIDYVDEFQFECDADNENLAHIHVQEYIELHVLRGENDDTIHTQYSLREGE